MNGKSILLVPLVLCFMISCATMPYPLAENETLVAGRVTLDFPDGFFRFPPRTIRNSIVISVRNVTTGQHSKHYTDDGYFIFISNGSDTYEITSLKCEVKIAYNTNVIDLPVGLRFHTKPKTVTFLGDRTYTFSAPRLVETVSGRGDGINSSFNYRIFPSLEKDPTGLKAYISAYDESSPWLEYEFVEPETAQSDKSNSPKW